MAPATPRSLVRVSPDRRLARSGVLAVLLVSLPIFGMLFFLGLDDGVWPVAIGGELLCLIATGIALVRFFGTFVEVTETTIEEREFLGRRTSTPRAEVHSVVLARTYRSSSSDSTPQLIVRGASGRRILRMRGYFWAEELISEVAAAIEVPVVRPHEPMSAKDFFADYPGSAYWFEDRPAVAVAGTVAAFVACVGGVYCLMWLLRLT